jgi:hypothetical protein
VWGDDGRVGAGCTRRCRAQQRQLSCDEMLLQVQRVSTMGGCVVAAAGLCVDVARGGGGDVHGTAITVRPAGGLVSRTHRARTRKRDRRVVGG